jgi:hypothetical protein
VGLEKLLGGTAIPAPGGGVNLHNHGSILAPMNCYAL